MEYIPQAGGDNSQLPGSGGVYNTVNFHLYHYAGNNPVKYTDPDGKTITSDDPSTNDDLLRDINLSAGPGFYFDEKNNLQLDENASPTGNYSKEVRDALKSFITGNYKDIQVNLLYSQECFQTVFPNEYSPGGSGIIPNYGFVSYGDPKGNTFRVGIPNLFENKKGESASVFIHEFMGHLLPTVRGDSSGNAVSETMPIIQKLGLTVPDFLKDAWAPGVPHDGPLPNIKEQGWVRPK